MKYEHNNTVLYIVSDISSIQTVVLFMLSLYTVYFGEQRISLATIPVTR